VIVFEAKRKILCSTAEVSNSNVFKGHILIKNSLAGRIKPKICVQGPHFSKIV